MWTSPEPRAILEQWGLVQKKCASNRRYRDVLIYPRRYTLTEYDRLFIDKLFDARQRHRLWQPLMRAANERDFRRPSAGVFCAVYDLTGTLLSNYCIFGLVVLRYHHTTLAQ